MNDKKQKNIVQEVREIREKQALKSFDTDYEYLQKKDPELFNKLRAELFSGKKPDDQNHAA